MVKTLWIGFLFQDRNQLKDILNTILKTGFEFIAALLLMTLVGVTDLEDEGSTALRNISNYTSQHFINIKESSNSRNN